MLYKELLNFCSVELSAFYFDIRKDSLYCDPKESQKRVSCILILNILLDCLLKWFAPILSFTTEEIQKLIRSGENSSIHLEKFPNIPSLWKNIKISKKWDNIKSIRDQANISIESKRAEKIIGSSLEADIKIKLNEKLYDIAKDLDFSEICITSSALLEKNNSENEIIVETLKAEGEKCPVCWKISRNKCPRHGHLNIS